MRTIDLKTWPRKNSFDFFSTYELPQFNICTNVTITKTYEFLDEIQISKFTAMLWLICLAANSVPELRHRKRGNTVIEHERVHPSFTWLNTDNTLTFCLAEYVPEVREFFSNVHNSVAGKETNPVDADKQGGDDVLYISCVPWINFTSISHPAKFDDTNAIPRITWGRFTRDDSQWTMPVSLQVHHGLADGYHAGLFFEKLQQILNAPESIAWPHI